jgi:hypothetical protein
MISLNDAQLKVVMAAAAHLPIEKRAQFLERIAAMLVLRARSRTFQRRDVTDAVSRALTGLSHQAVV